MLASGWASHFSSESDPSHPSRFPADRNPASRADSLSDSDERFPRSESCPPPRPGYIRVVPSFKFHPSHPHPNIVRVISSESSSFASDPGGQTFDRAAKCGPSPILHPGHVWAGPHLSRFRVVPSHFRVIPSRFHEAFPGHLALGPGSRVVSESFRVVFLSHFRAAQTNRRIAAAVRELPPAADMLYLEVCQVPPPPRRRRLGEPARHSDVTPPTRCLLGSVAGCISGFFIAGDRTYVWACLVCHKC